jgi:hypothetical protein
MADGWMDGSGTSGCTVCVVYLMYLGYNRYAQLDMIYPDYSIDVI